MLICLFRLAALLMLAGLTAWSSLAVYFGDSGTGTVQCLLAGGMVLAGAAAMAAQFMPRWRKRAAVVFLALFSGVLIWWLNLSPSNQRPWQTDVSRLPYAEFHDHLVTIHDIRNFSYRSETDYTPAWYTKTFDLDRLDSVDIFAVYWMGPAIAHMIVSFGFGGQDYVAVSIEARKERGEGYSAIRGFFRQYELIYVVADERDVIRLRTDFRKDPPEDVHLLPIKASREVFRNFFVEYFKTINALRDEPRFYNTLTTNCTNLIWMHARSNPQHVPFSWKVLLSGYAPEYLYSQDRIATTLPFDIMMQRSRINEIAQAAGDAPDFSRRIRASLEQAPRTRWMSGAMAGMDPWQSDGYSFSQQRYGGEPHSRSLPPRSSACCPAPRRRTPRQTAAVRASAWCWGAAAPAARRMSACSRCCRRCAFRSMSWSAPAWVPSSAASTRRG